MASVGHHAPTESSPFQRQQQHGHQGGQEVVRVGRLHHLWNVLRSQQQQQQQLLLIMLKWNEAAENTPHLSALISWQLMLQWKAQ